MYHLSVSRRGKRNKEETKSHDARPRCQPSANDRTPRAPTRAAHVGQLTPSAETSGPFASRAPVLAVRGGGDAGDGARWWWRRRCTVVVALDRLVEALWTRAMVGVADAGSRGERISRGVRCQHSGVADRSSG